MPRVERIQERMRANDQIGAGNGARRYFEWLLKQTALNTNALVPVENWRRGMVSDLEPHVRRRMLGVVKDKEYVTKLKDAFTGLEKAALFGNLLSHDNILAEQLSVDEVNEFFVAVTTLHRLVECPGGDTPLRYVREVREYRCRNPKCGSPIRLATN